MRPRGLRLEGLVRRRRGQDLQGRLRRGQGRAIRGPQVSRGRGAVFYIKRIINSIEESKDRIQERKNVILTTYLILLHIWCMLAAKKLD